MERRTALAYAAATAGVVLAGGTAFAAASGVVGHDSPDRTAVEDISSTSDSTTSTLPDPTVVTVVVDDLPALADDTSVASASDDPADHDLLDDNGGDRPAGVSDDPADHDAFDDHGDDDAFDDDADEAFDDHGDDATVDDDSSGHGSDDVGDDD